MKLQFIVSTHRIIGMAVTIFVIILSVSGLMLMHTDDLELADFYIENQHLLAAYDIAPETAPVSFLANGNYITQLDDRIYMNDSELAVKVGKIIGVIYVDGIYIVGFESSIMLVTSDGEIIETLGQTHGIPDGLIAIGSVNNNIIVNSGGALKSSDLNMSIWNDVNVIDVNWSEHSELPAQLMDHILNLYLGEGLPMERVILDIHSGRILGTAGVIMVDLAVVLFLILSLSGWLSWYKRRELQKLIDAEEL